MPRKTLQFSDILYATLFRAEIICEQNALKIVKKDISKGGNVISKVKVACTFSETWCI